VDDGFDTDGDRTMASHDSTAFADPDFHLKPVDIDGMAASIASWADDVVPWSRDGYSGFQARKDEQVYRILVEDGGSRMRFDRSSSSAGEVVENDKSEFLSRFLHKHGLGAVGRPQAGDPSPVVVSTLGRLNPAAFTVLKSIPEFGVMSYSIASGIVQGSPFAVLLSRLPGLASEIATAEHDREVGRSGSHTTKWGARRNRMILASDDPMAIYVGFVTDFAQSKWSMDLDPERVVAVTEIAGRTVALEDLGLLPWHTAFFATGPDEAVPRDPASMAKAIRFVERWTSLFGSLVGMKPEDFFAEFRDVFGYDWLKLAEAVDKLDVGLTFVSAEDIGTCLTRALAIENDIEPDEFDNESFVTTVGRLLAQRCVDGRGMVSLFTDVKAWYRSTRGSSDDMSDFLKLKTSGLVPAELADLSAVEIVRQLGVDVDLALELVEAGSEFEVEDDGTIVDPAAAPGP
jgi:hypothetical protein